MKHADFALLAVHDLDDIFQYIAKDNPKAAIEFVTLIKDRCLFLANNPGVGTRRPEYPGDIRSFPVGKYVVYFRPIDGGIEVVWVIHGARRVRSLS